MADEHLPSIKTGVKFGGGAPPGYEWNVDLFEQAFEEASEILDEEQYDSIADEVRELARQSDPTHSQTVDVRSVEDLFEVRAKGGILGKLNIRVFYFVNKPTRKIIVLGVIKKENNGPTPTGDKLRMRRRKRLYLEKYPNPTIDN